MKKIKSKKIVESIVSVPTAMIVEKVKKSPSLKPERPTSMILLFKVEGHNTYRSCIYRKKEDFDTYIKLVNNGKHPNVTERKWYVIDKINGTITEEK